MLKKDALAHYGSDPKTAVRNCATSLGISRQAVEKWGELVPQSSAWKLQVITKGKLRVQPELYQAATPSTNESHAAA